MLWITLSCQYSSLQRPCGRPSFIHLEAASWPCAQTRRQIISAQTQAVLLTANAAVVVVQSLTRVRLSVIPWTAAPQASLSISNSQSLLNLMSIKSVMPSNNLILCRPLLLLPSILPIIRVFSNDSALHIKWLKYWSLSFSIGPSNEYSGLISFRIDWFDVLAVQGTLKSLLQQHSLKASILCCSAFFIVQLSHPYTTTGETIASTRRNFVSNVSAL